MLHIRRSRLAVAAVAALSILGTACTKKVAVKPASQPVQTAKAAPATPPPAQQPASSTPAAPPAPARSKYPDAATQARIDELIARIQDAYFDYDKHNIRTDAQSTLTSDAKALGDILRQYPDYKLTIEGHCDERGSTEYNLALGDNRANAVTNALVQSGIPADSIKTISYGKEKPFCTEHTEDCWQQNRRAHFVYQK